MYVWRYIKICPFITKLIWLYPLPKPAKTHKQHTKLNTCHRTHTHTRTHAHTHAHTRTHTQVASLHPATHAYSFWEGVPRSGKAAFGRLFAASKTLKVCVRAFVCVCVCVYVCVCRARLCVCVWGEVRKFELMWSVSLVSEQWQLLVHYNSIFIDHSHVLEPISHSMQPLILYLDLNWISY